MFGLVVHIQHFGLLPLSDFPSFFSPSHLRYFAIGFVNCHGKRVRVPKDSQSIVYQIHLSGQDSPLSYTPNTEPWGAENIWYFASLSFKRSGQYTISFIAEGANAADIKPLVFRVTVEAQVVFSGPKDAINKLAANQYLRAENRLFWSARQRNPVMSFIGTDYSELASVKNALFLIYLALPYGSLMIDSQSSSETFLGRAGAVTSGEQFTDVFSCLAEPTGWNDLLDEAWRGAVEEARTPVALMECVLLLEYYINKAWLLPPASRLLTALPNPHFAVRCCTLSSVALRAFALDKALAYHKVWISRMKSFEAVALFP